MKNVLTLVAVLFGFVGFSQSCPVRNVGDGNFYSDNGMTWDSDAKKMVMEKVDFADSIVEICDADKVTFDVNSKQMVIENPKSFVIHGAIEIAETPLDKSRKRTIRYTIGDEVAYVE